MTLGIAAALFTVPHAQVPQERAEAIKQSVAANQAARRQYTWIETTEISMKRGVKKKQQKQCRYGADGKAQKTRAKQKIVENKVEDLKDYMEQVAALVGQYVDPQTLQAAFNLQPSTSGINVKEDRVTSYATSTPPRSDPPARRTRSPPRA